MDDIGASVINHVVAITDQIAALNWVLILSGVGICEAVITRHKKTGKVTILTWCLPLIIGMLFGVFNYFAHQEFKLTLRFIALALESAFAYMGWITLTYIVIRPFKYIGDYIKNRSDKKGS
jgi:prepilin signal peptidase PulO-like enzyme (type II secretory pathway)